MGKFRKLLMIVALLFPVMCFAQDDSTTVVNIDSCVAQISAKCPIEYKDGWALCSVANQGDTTAMALQVPDMLEGFLPALTADADNAKRLWMKQLSSMCGDDWRRLFRSMVASSHAFILDFVLEDETSVATMTFTPADLRK